MKRKKDDLDRLTEKLLKQDPSFKEEMDKADQAWDIAFQLHDLREKMGLTQTELAKLVGTRQSNIARIESADYTGYTLKTLEKVTRALKARLEIKIVSQETRNKRSAIFKGRVFSEETKLKMSIAAKARRERERLENLLTTFKI